MSEEAGNAAVGLEDSLKDFDVTGGAAVDFEDTIKEVLAVAEDPPDPKEEPAKGESDKEESAKEESAKEESDKEESDKEEGDDKEESDKEESDKEEEEDKFFDEFEDGKGVAEEADEDPVPKSVRSKKGREDWERMKEAKAKLRTQLQERDTELENLRRQVAEIPELRKQAEAFEEAERELALTRVESTAEYKEKVDKPLQEIESLAIGIAKSYEEVSADKLFDALAEPDAGQRRQLLKEVTEDMDSVDRDDVFQMARDTQVLLAEQNRIRAEAKEASKETAALAEKRTAEEQRKVRQEYESEVADVLPGLQKRLPFEELEKGETEDGVFQRIQEQASEADFDSYSTRKKAYVVASGLLVPRLTKQLQADRERIATLEARVKELNGKDPRVGDSTTEAPDEDYGGDVEAAVAAALGGKMQQPITEILPSLLE